MAKDLDVIIRRFIAEADAAAGGALQAVILYGSAAGDHYLPGRSDLNFLLIADTVDLALLDGLQKKAGAWGKKRIATPLVVQSSFLASSADSYPLEILGMMAGYRVLKGEDPFKGLVPQKEHVRLQVEREVKAKTLLFQSGYLESLGKHHRLLDCLTGALPALQAIVRGIVFLRDGDWRVCGSQLHGRCAAVIGVDGGVLDAIQAARSAKAIPDRRETLQLYARTLEFLRCLSGIVERGPSGI